MCEFFGCAGVEKYHLLRSAWANCGHNLHVNRDSAGHKGDACL